MTQDRVSQAAEWLFAARRERQRFVALPAALRPANDKEAYAMQAALQRHLQAEQGPLTGGKIALTTPQMQKMVGYDRPIAGGLLAKTIHRRFIELPARNFVHPGVECEVAVELGRPLGKTGAPHTAESVANAVAACMAAIELVDDRAADYADIDAAIIIADNAFNHGGVLAAPVRDWRALDLPAARGVTRVDGRIVGEGKGGDVMGGHPFSALAWLANHAASYGYDLQTGDVVLTGSLVVTQWAMKGQTVEVEIEGLGTAGIRFL